MDPCSQGLLGAALANSFSKKTNIKVSSLCGFIGGVAADLDVFIKSDVDNLFFIEFHRHFTHSISFVPIGGLIVSTFLFIFMKKNYSFRIIYIYSSLGFLTHGLLDACTSYGTLLLWPFSNTRVTWNIISIIDPLFTIILLITIFLCLSLKRVVYARYGLIFSVFYLLICTLKSYQVKSFVESIAQSRKHNIEKLMLNPTIGNNILWRTIYQTNKSYYVDAVYMPYIGKPLLKKGVKVDLIKVEEIFPELSENSVQMKDIERFTYFSKGYIYLHPLYNNIIADLRYGTLPHDDRSLWGVEVNPLTPDEHVKFKNLRNFQEDDLKNFWLMLNGDFNLIN